MANPVDSTNNARKIIGSEAKVVSGNIDREAMKTRENERRWEREGSG